jgi:hypothetical protein
LLQHMQTRQRALRLASMCSKAERQLGGTGSAEWGESNTLRGMEAGSGQQAEAGLVWYTEPAELSLASNAGLEVAGGTSWVMLGGEEEISARLADLEVRKEEVIPPLATEGGADSIGVDL